MIDSIEVRVRYTFVSYAMSFSLARAHIDVESIPLKNGSRDYSTIMHACKIILVQGLDGPTVEDYVRISAGTKILPGITIGKYALIGAGSVVTKDIPSKAVVYGVPVEVKAFQTDEEIKEYIDSIKSWEY